MPGSLSYVWRGPCLASMYRTVQQAMKGWSDWLLLWGGKMQRPHLALCLRFQGDILQVLGLHELQLFLAVLVCLRRPARHKLVLSSVEEMT